MYPQIKVLANTNEIEVNQFLKENAELTPVIVSAEMIALPGRSNMLQAQLYVIIQLHGEDEVAVEATEELVSGGGELKVEPPKADKPKVEEPKATVAKVEKPKE